MHSPADSSSSFPSVALSQTGSPTPASLPSPQSSGVCPNRRKEVSRMRARELQQMMEQLASSHLVEVEDLLMLGFTEDEIRETGLHIPSPHDADEEHIRETEFNAVRCKGVDRRCRHPARKRAWDSDDVVMQSLQGLVAPAPLTPMRLLSTEYVHQCKTEAKLVVVAPSPPIEISPLPPQPQPQPLLPSKERGFAPLSEQERMDRLGAAKLVMQTQKHRPCRIAPSRVAPHCARGLSYEDTMDENEEEEAPGAYSTPCTGGTTSLYGTSRVTVPSCGNTALAFTGLDVAVVKEIAQQLQGKLS